MSTTSPAEISVQDTVVFLGAGVDGAHWIVPRIGEPTLGRVRVLLRSGRSGRRRGAYLDELELWRPLLVDPSPTRYESLAHHSLVTEMLAEGMVERVAEALVTKFAGREFMVEVKVFDATEDLV
jgi:hypothetical protein